MSRLSKMADEVLKAVTSKESSFDDLVEMYEELFDLLQRYSKKYGVEVLIGETHDSEVVFSNSVHDIDYSLHISNLYDGHDLSVREAVPLLYRPTRIIHNFIESIIESSETNREKIIELEISLRWLKTILEGENRGGISYD
jgi:hypothetical protein